MAIWHNRERSELNRPDGINDAFLYITHETEYIKPDYASTFAINGAYPFIIPDYYICCENEDKYMNVLNDSCIKIFRKKYYRSYFSEFDNTYFVDLYCFSRGMRGMWEMNRDNPSFFWVGTSLGVALNVIVYMGYRRVHFCGAELNGYENYAARRFIQEFAQVGENYGIECISRTPKSSLNSFLDFMPLR